MAWFAWSDLSNSRRTCYQVAISFIWRIRLRVLECIRKPNASQPEEPALPTAGHEAQKVGFFGFWNPAESKHCFGSALVSHKRKPISAFALASLMARSKNRNASAYR